MVSLPPVVYLVLLSFYYKFKTQRNFLQPSYCDHNKALNGSLIYQALVHRMIEAKISAKDTKKYYLPFLKLFLQLNWSLHYICITLYPTNPSPLPTVADIVSPPRAPTQVISSGPHPSRLVCVTHYSLSWI